MPVHTLGNLQIDFTDDGEGPAVILSHSSASGNRQWRSLTKTDLRRKACPVWPDSTAMFPPLRKRGTVRVGVRTVEDPRA